MAARNRPTWVVFLRSIGYQDFYEWDERVLKVDPASAAYHVGMYVSQLFYDKKITEIPSVDYIDGHEQFYEMGFLDDRGS